MLLQSNKIFGFLKRFFIIPFRLIMLTATGCFWRRGSGKYYIRRLAAAELLSPENKESVKSHSTNRSNPATL